MRKLIIFAAFALAGCTVGHSQDYFYSKAASHPVETAHNPVAKSDATADLIARFDRLESSVNALLAYQQKTRSDLLEFGQCMDRCGRIPADFDDDSLDWRIQFKSRSACHDSCEKIRPAEYGAIGC